MTTLSRTGQGYVQSVSIRTKQTFPDPGQFTLPSSLAIDGADNVYVLDTINYRVQKFRPVFTGEGEGEGVMATSHSADSDGNAVIGLSEVLRLVQFYNSNGFHCDASTEDGYAARVGDTTCAAHASDFPPHDWRIGLTELLRGIQVFNSSHYHACPEVGTEDGYCPGPIGAGSGENALR